MEYPIVRKCKFLLAPKQNYETFSKGSSLVDS